MKKFYVFLFILCFLEVSIVRGNNLNKAKGLLLSSLSKKTSKKFLNKKNKKNKNKKIIKTSFSTGYDDNIIQLSAKDKSNFDSGDIKYSTHFAIKSINDFILKPDISYAIKNKKQNLNFSYAGNFYTKNNVKNYSTFSINGDKKLNKKTNLSFNYYFIPSFYIRNLKDIDDKDVNGTYIYHQAKLKINGLSFSFEKNLKNKTNFNLTLNYTVKDFNKNFNERDTNSLGSKLSFQKYFSKILRGDFSIFLLLTKQMLKEKILLLHMLIPLIKNGN